MTKYTISKMIKGQSEYVIPVLYRISPFWYSYGGENMNATLWCHINDCLIGSWKLNDFLEYVAVLSRLWLIEIWTFTTMVIGYLCNLVEPHWMLAFVQRFFQHNKWQYSITNSTGIPAWAHESLSSHWILYRAVLCSSTSFFLFICVLSTPLQCWFDFHHVT
jgi:hypothetical protein